MALGFSGVFVGGGVAVAGVAAAAIAVGWRSWRCPFVGSGEHVDERAAGDHCAALRRRREPPGSAPSRCRSFGCEEELGALEPPAPAKRSWRSRASDWPEALMSSRSRQAERAQRLAQFRAPVGERLRGGGRLRADAREQALAGLAEVDADLAELFGLQSDPRLGLALPDGDVDGGADRLDHFVHANTRGGRRGRTSGRGARAGLRLQLGDGGLERARFRADRRRARLRGGGCGHRSGRSCSPGRSRRRSARPPSRFLRSERLRRRAGHPPEPDRRAMRMDLRRAGCSRRRCGSGSLLIRPCAARRWEPARRPRPRLRSRRAAPASRAGADAPGPAGPASRWLQPDWRLPCPCPSRAVRSGSGLCGCHRDRRFRRVSPR